MAFYDYDLGVIGGGAAGLTAAAGAAQFGARIILIEKSHRLGGECLHSGCVPSKTLIRSAGVRSLMRRSAEFGLPGLDLPPVDLGAVMDRVHAVIDKIQLHDSPKRFCSLGALVRFGNASFTDEHVVDLEGERISARSWIIATGSRPGLPPVEGLSEVPYWTNENVFTKRSLPERLIVLGGGAVGCELAQAFGRLGSRVRVVEPLDRILPAEDPDMAEILARRFSAEGIEVITLARAVRAASKAGVISLTVGPVTGEEPFRVLECDAVLVATGRRPNGEGLGLEKAGVRHTAAGIPVNGRMKTNIPHIYACGDVNGVLPFTHVAGYEAGIALANAVLRLPRRADYTRIGWCTYTDPEVASIGLNEKRAREKGIAYRILEERFEENDRALAEGEPWGKIKLLVDPGGKLLGCQIIGARAGELIHEWVLAAAAGSRLSTVASAVHIYPTLSEISKRSAGSLFAAKLFSTKTRALLKVLFNLKGRACTMPRT